MPLAPHACFCARSVRRADHLRGQPGPWRSRRLHLAFVRWYTRGSAGRLASSTSRV